MALAGGSDHRQRALAWITTMDRLANPAPLGLAGFGMTTVLLNLHNAGFYELDAMILGMGIFFGGFAQIVAGILEFQKGNTFGMTAFTSYGCFWLTLVFLVLAPKTGVVTAPNDISMACYLGMWGLFTFFLALGTLRANKVLQAIFWSLTVLFGLLAVHKALGKTPLGNNLGILAGFEGIVCGGLAFYLAVAEVVNEKLQRAVLPVGEYKAPAVVTAQAAEGTQVALPAAG